jgi:CheY-like chemotaxis protein
MFDTETNILKEAQKLIFVFQNEARIKRLDLSLNIGPGFERLGVERIMTDPVRLGQVVTNLLSNAIRFTSNSAVRRVELRLDLGLDPPEDGCAKPPAPSNMDVELDEETQLYLYVSVVDTGPGLTPAELETLFQRFRQASPETHTVYGGSGLGLYVCRQLTERMGGHIDVVSEHGRGSEFRFYIRTHACTSPESPPAEGANNDLAGPFKPHILIVEDNIINRTVLMRQLQHVGLTVESASNGLEALERLRTSQRSRKAARANGVVSNPPSRQASSRTPSRPASPAKGHRRAVSSISNALPKETPTEARRFDCVLMDLEMPVMDGYTSVRLLRADEAKGLLAPTNVVALTGNARQAQMPEAIDDSIRKHVSGTPRTSSESMRSWISSTDLTVPHNEKDEQSQSL